MAQGGGGILETTVSICGISDGPGARNGGAGVHAQPRASCARYAAPAAPLRGPAKAHLQVVHRRLSIFQVRKQRPKGLK